MSASGCMGRDGVRPIATVGLVLVALSAACAAPEHGPALFGHAVLRGLQDHSGITVSLPALGRHTTTDSYGYFAFPDVPPGTYDVVATHPGTRQRQVVRQVHHDSTVTSVLLVLSPIGRIHGTVNDPAGQGIAGAVVSVLGTDVSTTTVEGGAFVLDPVPAGSLQVLATAQRFTAATAAAALEAGGDTQVDLTLQPSTTPDPYAGNRPPTIGPIQITAQVDSGFPRPIPLVDTSSDRVRRRGLYELSVRVSDPDGDPVRVFWSADRGTLGDPGDASVSWRAGSSVQTLVATAVDPFGATATTRRVVQASGDSIRGAGRWGQTIYYSEERTSTYDVYSYNLDTGAEALVAGGPGQQHAATVSGDWLVYGDTEFAFIGPLTYRIRAQNLRTGVTRLFGRPLGHDDYPAVNVDIYTPLSGTLIPYASYDAAVAPPGFGFYDFATDTTRSFFEAAGSPSSFTAFATSGSGTGTVTAWETNTGDLWLQRGRGSARVLANFANTSPVDVQLAPPYLVVLPAAGGPLAVFNIDTPNAGTQFVGNAVTSFALHGTRVAYVEQGPSSASVVLDDLASGESRTLTQQPHFARRIWYLDDTYVIWGDQGEEGRAFVALDTELLWVDRL